MSPLSLLARHAGVVVVDKPAGLASTGRTLEDPDCVQGQLMGQLKRRKVWAVHQLDKLTSGVNVFVLRKALVAEWSERMRYPNATKIYLAVAKGTWPDPSVGELHVRQAIGKVQRGVKTFPGLVDEANGGKAAHSVVRRLATSRNGVAVAVELRTGRTHQVRLHLASLGLPIVGDPLHGVEAPEVAEAGMALHAWRLTVTDAQAPLSKLEAPIPQRLVRIAEHLGLSFGEENR